MLRVVATPGTDDVGGPKASQISELRRTAKWHDPPGEIEEGNDLLTGEELQFFQSVMDRPDLLYSVKELIPTDIHGPRLDSNIEVCGDANFAGLQEKIHSKRCRDVQSFLGDFCLCGHVAIKSDATAAIGMVHRLGLGKVRHLAVGDLWVQHHARSGKIRVSQMSGLENPNNAQTKYLWPEPLLRHTKACNWSLLLMMASRDECRWVVLCRGVDFNSFRTQRRMDKSGQEGHDEWTKLKICPEDPEIRENRKLQQSADVRRSQTACSRREVFFSLLN